MRLAVDTSALVAILFEEPEQAIFDEALSGNEPIMSAATLVEVGRATQLRFGRAGVAEVDQLVDAYGIMVEPVDHRQAKIALDAMLVYGKGRGSPPAVLNFGDLFSYALAKARGLPLLYKGDDFSQTDIPSALNALGVDQGR